MYCDLEYVHTCDLVFQLCQKSIKQALKESTACYLLHRSWCVNMSVIHQLSVSAGLACACGSITFYVDLSKQAVCETSVQTFSQNRGGTAG